MATLLHLSAQGIISKYDAQLSWRQQEYRRLYLAPRAISFLDQKLPSLSSCWETEVSPLEQVDDLLAAYCAGDTLLFQRQFWPLWHIEAGVWELKTPDVRLFGWFPARDCFVCTNGDDAGRIKEFDLYAGYRDEAVRFRNELDLDDPKFIPGDDPNAVLSVIDIP